MRDTLPLLEISDFPTINRNELDILQVNLGYKCNQSCVHCHVNAGPTRTEMMTKENLSLVLDVLSARKIKTLDLTGGAPELHDGFRNLVTEARKMEVHLIDRCNLTVLFEPGQEGLADFLAEQEVEIVASLPCYSLKNVDQQRGKGVFDKSISGLQWLNRLGYGKGNLKLNLVYNPQGPHLPPNQRQLEVEYKRELKSQFDIEFNQLFVLANMPIKRFGSMLVSKQEFIPYMNLLKHNFSEANIAGLMCKNLVSVDWQGYLYDCDFNQQLNLPLGEAGPNAVRHLCDLLTEAIDGNLIRVADHCFGCTAGQGSSCGGAL